MSWFDQFLETHSDLEESKCKGLIVRAECFFGLAKGGFLHQIRFRKNARSCKGCDHCGGLLECLSDLGFGSLDTSSVEHGKFYRVCILGDEAGYVKDAYLIEVVAETPPPPSRHINESQPPEVSHD